MADNTENVVNGVLFRLGLTSSEGGSKTSNFKVNPKNILGLDARKTKSKLLALALSKPEEYYKLREEVIEQLTSEAVDGVYETYWNVLTNGRIPGKNPIIIPDGSGTPFSPNLPESDVNKFALKVANAIYEISSEAVEAILPMKFKQLAIEQQEELLTEKGISI
jgi:hypothetical protein